LDSPRDLDMPSPLTLAAAAGHALLGAADDLFAWIADPRVPATQERVPAPPRPEPIHRGRRADGDRRRVRGMPLHSLEWKELNELRLALGENQQSVKRLSLDLASRSVEAQTIVERNEVALADRRTAYRLLRERVDAAPAARAQRLEELHAQAHAAGAALDEARAAVALSREAARADEQLAWQGAEERAAAFAADCARETAHAEAAERESLASLRRLAERLVRAEDELASSVGNAPRSRRVQLGARRDELATRRVATTRFTHERPAVLQRRLQAMHKGAMFTLRGSSLEELNCDDGAVVSLRLSDERPPSLLVDGVAPLSCSLSLPLTHCVRICIGRAEDASLAWTFPELIERLGSIPPAAPRAREHLCFTLLFARAPTGPHAEAGVPLALHLMAAAPSQLEDWLMGMQPLSGLWPTDKVSPATLRWRALRLRMRGMRS
jgi:hypothetical protein